jgi:hypothetical protein
MSVLYLLQYLVLWLERKWQWTVGWCYPMSYRHCTIRSMALYQEQSNTVGNSIDKYKNRIELITYIHHMPRDSNVSTFLLSISY